MIIDPEFQSLCPPLCPEERAHLEANIQQHGCRDALVVWKGPGILLDGHNRYAICSECDIGFETVEIELADRDAAIGWVIRNQFGRRNLTPHQRAELALKLELSIKAKAKRNQGQRTDILENSPKCSEPVNTREEIATAAGVSSNTVAKVKRINRHAIPEIQEMSRRAEVSINAAEQVSRLPVGQQREIALQGPEAVRGFSKPTVNTSNSPHTQTDDYAAIRSVNKAFVDVLVTLKIAMDLLKPVGINNKGRILYCASKAKNAINAIIEGLK